MESKDNEVVHSFFNPGELLRPEYLNETDLHMGDMVI